jgi:hypothetical protein
MSFSTEAYSGGFMARSALAQTRDLRRILQIKGTIG